MHAWEVQENAGEEGAKQTLLYSYTYTYTYMYMYICMYVCMYVCMYRENANISERNDNTAS